jgi:hypothetical protein
LVRHGRGLQAERFHAHSKAYVRLCQRRHPHQQLDAVRNHREDEEQGSKTKSKDPYEVSTAGAAICAIPQLVDGVEQRNAGFANGVAGT